MAVAFANIFMAKIEKEILRQSSIKPIFWKRFIVDVVSVWDTSRNEIEQFLLKANNFHPTIKFTAVVFNPPMLSTSLMIRLSEFIYETL